MPRLPIDYSKTIIYKICCNDVNIKEIYVGHTTDIVRRRNHHKSHINNEKSKEYNKYKYQFIRDNGGWENWSLVPIELYKCDDVNQACIRERYWIEELKASLNKYLPSRSKKEYSKERYENNKEKINEKQKEYREHNKEKISEKHKEYYQENKEIINEKHREYYSNNKEKLSEKFTCECGSVCRIADKNRHFNSKKHQEYLTTINKDRQVGSS